MAQKLQAVLFDMDGTLLDSRPAIIPAFEHALRRHNVPVPPLAEILPHAHSLEALHEVVAPHVPYADLLASYDGRLQTLLHKIVAYDRVVEVLRELKKHYKLGVVSSSRRAQQATELYGLSEFFNVVIGAQDVAERKPHPAPVLLALKRLDVRPEHAAMVGDLAADVLAAKAAGVGLVVGVTHGFGSREVLEAEGADAVVDNLPEVLQTIKKFSV